MALKIAVSNRSEGEVEYFPGIVCGKTLNLNI
jgi:hypothetical protein